jgi:hypothetical protein
MTETPEQRSATGKPMVAETPRDMIHIRLGSFVLIFALAIGAIAAAAGVIVLSIICAVVALIAAVDIIIALRRRAARTMPGEYGSSPGPE